LKTPIIGPWPAIVASSWIEWLHVHNYAEAWIGEDHFGGYEIYGRPKLFIATAAERTRYIRLDTGVISLPYLLNCQAHTISGG